MRILVDADACPVKGIIEKVAQAHQIAVTMFIDCSHVLQSDYSHIITVGQGRDAVDLVLINEAKAGDIVVTQDYGVAALALAKKACAISNEGLIFTNENIEGLLGERHTSAKVRRAGGRMGRFKKRLPQLDEKFERQFSILIKSIVKEQAR